MQLYRSINFSSFSITQLLSLFEMLELKIVLPYKIHLHIVRRLS